MKHYIVAVVGMSIFFTHAGQNTEDLLRSLDTCPRICFKSGAIRRITCDVQENGTTTYQVWLKNGGMATSTHTPRRPGVHRRPHDSEYVTDYIGPNVGKPFSEHRAPVGDDPLSLCGSSTCQEQYDLIELVHKKQIAQAAATPKTNDELRRKKRTYQP